MIILKTLKWSNAFSYGTDNVLDLSKDKVVQLIGANGNGKSSIAWILEEVLFNKNSKGRKKESILNWNSSAKAYEIELDFSIGSDDYTVRVKRASTQSVTLIKNGEDISSHTATNTFKHIEAILGYTQKTFSQIACQTHSSSLEFLTSPDTARKKFLIDLINLNQYIQIGELLKKLNIDLNKELSGVSGKLSTVESWIKTNNSIDKTKKSLIEVPVLDRDLGNDRDSLVVDISNVDATNTKIRNNLVYVQSLEKLATSVDVPAKPQDNRSELIASRAEYNKAMSDANALKNKILGLKSTCPTCLQPVTKEFKDYLISEQDTIIEEAAKVVKAKDLEIESIRSLVAQWESSVKMQNEIERLHALIDSSLPKEYIDKQELKSRLEKIDARITSINKEIKTAEYHNKQAEIHNNKIDIVTSQLDSYIKELEQAKITYESLASRINRINILIKAFSVTGLVAYKLESITNELESLVNSYLTQLSNGQFQLEFKLSGSDKLDIIITNNGQETDISSLSAGETTRVNIAVLLAIRKLMQHLTGSSINILFLDEAISTLDSDGKEKLVDVLLEEDNLNTILVSHEFQHPLITNIQVIKENNISKLLKE